MTEIPKQYVPKSAEEKCLKLWDDLNIFHSEPNRQKKPFTIVIPPPNVTGALHLGHALNNTLQDIVIRMKRMQGYETLWMPGVDHAGIATQAVVERKLFEEEKKTRHDIGREALVERIWAWKEQYQNRILSQLKAMGCSCDWARTRFTLDETCAKAVRHFFFKLFEDGLIYRGKKLVNWDTHLQTAVSDDELFHESVDGNFWHIKYQVIDPQLGEPTHVIVATTRPETMLGDTAVAIHPEPAEFLDNAEKEIRQKLQNASDKDKAELMEQLMDVCSRKMSVFLTNMKALVEMAQDGRRVMLPLVNRPIPLVLDEWAKPNLGTGCVKITPAHDPNDYDVAVRRKLPMINILNKDGTLNENGGKFKGLSMHEARKQIVAELEKHGHLVETQPRKIEIAHSDRSKTPIEPFLHDQWHIKMDMLSQLAIDAVESRELCSRDSLQFVPERYTKGYVDWLSEKRDWPIGRQLYWGHRIPIWLFEGSENELKNAFGDREDVAWQYDSQKKAFWVCSLTEDLDFGEREEDVLDTWFSSALWPLSTLGWPDETPELNYYYPTNVLITSRDIITLWVARMTLAGRYLRNQVPFHQVYITPKVLDKFGEGMSKSKGNGIDPLDVIEKFGADAMRFALAMLTTESQDIRLSVDFECPHCQAAVEQTKKNRTLPKIECPKCKKAFKTQWAETAADKALPLGPVVGERFEVARNFCNKLWNAARYVLMNNPLAAGLVPAVYFEDKWILSRLSHVTESVTTALDEFRYADAAKTLYEFAWDDFCSFYLEMTKDRQDAQPILLHVLKTLLRLLHPFIPFVTEEIWQQLGEKSSISVTEWPTADKSQQNPQIEEQFTVFQELLRGVREIRASRNIPPKTAIEFSVCCDEAKAELLKPLVPYFERLAKAKLKEPFALQTEREPFATEAFSALSGMSLYVNLADFIDVKAERAKKCLELEKLKTLIENKESKLSGDFIQKAPEAIVKKERDSLADLKQQYESTKKAIEAC